MTEQQAVKPSKLWDRLFGLWVGVGFLLIVMSASAYSKCPSLNHLERTFRFVPKDPDKRSEREAQYEAYDKCEARLTALAKGALAYGFLGALVFFRRGCAAFFIAGGVIVFCGWLLLEMTWVPL